MENRLKATTTNYSCGDLYQNVEKMRVSDCTLLYYDRNKGLPDNVLAQYPTLFLLISIQFSAHILDNGEQILNEALFKKPFAMTK